MKAIYFKGKNNITVAEIPVPKITRPDEVLIKIKTAGLCGSDLHFLHEGGTSDFIQGHEGAGVVEEIGANVDHLKPGDRVAIYHKIGCQDCGFCSRGWYNQCPDAKGQAWHTDGVDTEYTVSDQRYLLKLPEQLSFYDGSMIACGAGTGYSVVSKLHLSSAATLVLFGLGPLGLACAKIARGFGARVIGIDVNAQRLALAKDLGLETVSGGGDEDQLYQTLRELEPHGIYHVLDTSGNRHARAQAVQLAAPNAKIALVGMRDNLNTIFDIDNMIRKQLTLFGSYVYPITLWDEMKRFFVKQQISFSDLVTRTYQLTEAEKAFTEFDAGLAGKAFFVLD